MKSKRNRRLNSNLTMSSDKIWDSLRSIQNIEELILWKIILMIDIDLFIYLQVVVKLIFNRVRCGHELHNIYKYRNI